MLLVKTLFFVCLCACPSRDAPLEAPSGSTQSKATPSTTVTEVHAMLYVVSLHEVKVVLAT